ncbi:MAG: SLC13 family permease [Verrucomicrobiia bacterium]
MRPCNRALMTFSMVLVLVLLVVALGLFIWEKFAVELIALGILCVLVLTGILTAREAFAVFGDEAPLTVAAMFVLSGLLLHTGGVAGLTEKMTRLTAESPAKALAVLFIVAGGASAFINNTPVVAILIPVVIHMTRENGLSSSRFLIPLSYAALLGGCCTLIGTSTNLVVHGIATRAGLPGFHMFELGQMGLPLLVVCGVLVLWLAPTLLPARQTVASLLTAEQRRSRIYQLLVARHSPLVRKRLLDCGFMKAPGVVLLEVRRKAERITTDWTKLKLEPFDRLTIVASKVLQSESDPEQPTLFLGAQKASDLGLEILSAIPGGVAEAVIGPRSPLAGKTLRQLRLRSEFAVQVIAVHRKGQNLQDRFMDLALHVGDTLLILGSDAARERLQTRGDLVIADVFTPHKAEVETTPRWQTWTVWITIAAVVFLPTLGILPISSASVTACVLLALLGIVKTDRAIQSIDWGVMLTIYGMLALGVAVEKVGLDEWVATKLVLLSSGIVGPELTPWILLSAFTFVTIVLTEIISNNAAAAVMAPLAIGLAAELGVSAQPFLVAVALGASLAFAIPMGYQTHLMVYGVGGYRFTDFLRLGLPLDVIVWLGISLFVPLLWRF